MFCSVYDVCFILMYIIIPNKGISVQLNVGCTHCLDNYINVIDHCSIIESFCRDPATFSMDHSPFWKKRPNQDHL